MAERKPVKCPKPAPCPWCRGRALSWHMYPSWIVYCTHFGVNGSCGVRGPQRTTEASAIQSWNRIALKLDVKRGGKGKR